MKNKSEKWLVGIAVAMAVASMAWLWFSGRRQVPNAPANEPSPAASQIPAATTASLDAQELESAARGLALAKSAEDQAAARAALRKSLTAGPTNETPAAIRKMLDSNVDASTGQGFKVGGGGAMLETPTLRTWLLDQLAVMDPAAAADYAREILNSSHSADEWAIALRNLARGDKSSDARALLASKTGELLRSETWQRDPSVGYLEAFDTAVYVGGTDLLPPLSDLVSRKDNPAVAHAAFLALDRLVINQPARVLAELSAHPERLAGREETRANYFARANVGDPEQRRVLETYLLDPARSPAELRSFAGVFPNANFMISHNLLTENKTPDGPTLARRDRASLEVVNQWLADDRFRALNQPLTRIQQRLQEFNRQSENR